MPADQAASININRGFVINSPHLTRRQSFRGDVVRCDRLDRSRADPRHSIIRIQIPDRSLRQNQETSAHAILLSGPAGTSVPKAIEA